MGGEKMPDLTRLVPGGEFRTPKDGPRSAARLLLRAVVRRTTLTWPLTATLLAVNAGLFVAAVVTAPGYQWFTGAGRVPALLAQFGVLPAAVAQGEVWRLMTAGFLHLSVVHLALNSIGLYQAGRFCEVVYGTRRFAMIYLIALVAGNVLADLTSAPRSLTVGASGAILGAFGAMAVAASRYPMLTPALTGAIAPILLTLANGFTHTGISNAAHIGGVVAGAASAWRIGVLPELETRYRAHLRAQLENDLAAGVAQPRPTIPPDVMNDPQNHLVLRPRKLSLLGLVLLFLVLSGVFGLTTVLALSTPKPETLLVLVSALLLAFFLMVTVLTGLQAARMRLELDPEGFTLSGVRRRRVSWYDVEEFALQAAHVQGANIRQVTYRYRPGYIESRRRQGKRVLGLGQPQGLPAYLSDPEELARLLESWRQRWTAPSVRPVSVG